MKTIILTVSLAIATLLEYQRYLFSKNLVGCGMAPDGTSLTSCYSILGGMIMIIALTALLSLILYFVATAFRTLRNKKK